MVSLVIGPMQKSVEIGSIKSYKPIKNNFEKHGVLKRYAPMKTASGREKVSDFSKKETGNKLQKQTRTKLVQRSLRTLKGFLANFADSVKIERKCQSRC